MMGIFGSNNLFADAIGSRPPHSHTTPPPSCTTVVQTKHQRRIKEAIAAARRRQKLAQMRNARIKEQQRGMSLANRSEHVRQQQKRRRQAHDRLKSALVYERLAAQRRCQWKMREQEDKPQPQLQRKGDVLGKNLAAAKIQRWWRMCAERCKEDRAARVVTRAVRARGAELRFSAILASMRALRAMEQSLAKALQDAEAIMGSIQHGDASDPASPASPKKRLHYMLAMADALERVILSLDSVQTHNSDAVRHRRKALVARAQQALARIDKRAETSQHKAATMDTSL